MHEEAQIVISAASIRNDSIIKSDDVDREPSPGPSTRESVTIALCAVIALALSMITIILIKNSDRAPTTYQTQAYSNLKADILDPLMNLLALVILVLSYTPYWISRRQPYFLKEKFERDFFHKTGFKKLHILVLANSFNTHYIPTVLWLPFYAVIYCFNFYWNRNISIAELFYILVILTTFVIIRKSFFWITCAYLFFPMYTCAQLWKILLNKSNPQNEIV